MRYSFIFSVDDSVIATCETDADPPRVGDVIMVSAPQVSEPFLHMGLEHQDLVVRNVKHVFGEENRTQVFIDVQITTEEFRQTFESARR